MILAAVLVLLLTGCYYDTEEELYPATGNCDTLNVTYSNTIAPVMLANCVMCHSGSAPSAGISLDTYDNVKIYANNGALSGSMNHSPGFSPMPKGGNKTDACTLLKLQAWINGGMPN